MKKVLHYLITVIDGLCMAIANSVPGVSGGTVALLMGFYDDMIDAINNIIFKKGKRLSGLIYILFLGIGWGGGMIGASKVLEKVVFTSEPNTYALFSLFFGFVLFSIPMMIYDERKNFGKKNLINLLWLVVGAALIVGMTVFLAKPVVGEGLDLAVFDFPKALFLILVGALAIVAMLLPGVSGSTVFLVFGVYEDIMGNAIPGLLRLDFSTFPMMCFLGVGAVAGGLGAVKGIRFCLDRFRPQMIYTIIGMLIGSLYSIIVGPGMLENPIPDINFGNFNWLFFAIGALVIAGFEFFKIYGEKKKAKETKEEK